MVKLTKRANKIICELGPALIATTSKDSKPNVSCVEFLTLDTMRTAGSTLKIAPILP